LFLEDDPGMFLARILSVRLLTVVFSAAMVLALLVKRRIQAIVWIIRGVAPIDILA